MTSMVLFSSFICSSYSNSSRSARNFLASSSLDDVLGVLADSLGWLSLTLRFLCAPLDVPVDAPFAAGSRCFGRVVVT